MAINPQSKYPSNVAPADANYPYGSARNVATTGDGTGKGDCPRPSLKICFPSRINLLLSSLTATVGD